MLKDEASFLTAAKRLTQVRQDVTKLKRQTESEDLSQRELNYLYIELEEAETKRDELTSSMKLYDLEFHEGRKGGWIPTFSGKRIWLEDPRPEDFEIADIAHCLACIARYNGQLKSRYCVAQHCTLASRNIEARYQQLMLMHDASEAYLQDIISPLKRLIKPIYEPLEMKMMEAIAERFGFSVDAEACIAVKTVDMKMLCTEIRDLSTTGILVEDCGEVAFDWHIHGGYDERLAEKLFLDRFNYLFPKKVISYGVSNVQEGTCAETQRGG